MGTFKRSNSIIILWILISSFGIISIYSASMPELITNGQLPFKTALVQLIIFIACIVMFAVVIKMRKKGYRFLYRTIDVLFWGTIISLILVLLIGENRGGARMVISLGPIDFQPVELYKITVILFLAKHLTGKDKPKTFMELIFLCAKACGPGFVLLFLQPDLGGALIILGIVFFMACLYGEFMDMIIKCTAGAAVAGALVLLNFSQKLMEHQSARFTAWLNPFGDAKDTGWGAIQALIAISNGDVTGVGYMNSIQKTIFKTGASTDYIFVIICEEWGLIGALAVLGGLILLSYLCMLVGNNAKDRFGMLYCYGYALLILLQTFVNVGGVVNIIPMTGVTLPFISNGMNSFVFLSIGLLIVIMIDHESVRNKRKLNEMSDKLFL